MVEGFGLDVLGGQSGLSIGLQEVPQFDQYVLVLPRDEQFRLRLQNPTLSRSVLLYLLIIRRNLHDLASME